MEQKQKKKKLLLKTTVLTGVIGILGIGSLLIFSKPSQAILDDLISIFDDLSEYFPEVAIVNEWLDIINSTIADPCSGVDILSAVPIESGWCSAVEDAINGDFTSIIETATGELGIPSPLEVQRVIKEESLTQVSDNPFVDNPHTFLELEQNIADRALTKLNTESVIGTTGQENREKTLNKTSEKVAEIIFSAQSAQNLTSTQDVLKSLVQIQAIETAIAQIYQQDQYLARNDQQYANLNLTNISRTLDGDSKVRILNQKGNAAKALYWSSQLSLF